MIRKIASLAAVCLLVAGCTGLGSSPRGPGGGPKLIPGGFPSRASNESFARAVANDPFPSARQSSSRP
jgi:hypothetical protein